MDCICNKMQNVNLYVQCSSEQHLAEVSAVNCEQI